LVELLQDGYFRGVEDGLLEGDGGASVFELEGGDLVVEEGGSWIRPTIAAKDSWKEAEWSRSW
jgi:hypothetical protein